MPRPQFMQVIDTLETVMQNSIAINSMMDPLVVRTPRASRRAAPAAATHALLSRLQEAFCQEAPTSPICPGGSPQYEYVEDRPGETAPLSLPRMPAPRV